MEIITKLEDRFSLLEIAEVRGKTLLDIGVGPLAMIAARDFSWLENELKLLSAVEKYEGDKMNLSICFKRK